MGGLDTVVAKIPKRNARLQLFGFGVVHAEGLHGDLLHALVGLRLVVHAGLGGGDAVDHVHALGDHAEGGILAVQELPVGVHDEELAPAESMAWARAIDSTPRLWLMGFFTPLAENSPLMQ